MTVSIYNECFPAALTPVFNRTDERPARSARLAGIINRGREMFTFRPHDYRPRIVIASGSSAFGTTGRERVTIRISMFE